jgi:hypothetical protein
MVALWDGIRIVVTSSFGIPRSTIRFACPTFAHGSTQGKGSINSSFHC